ncbi:MAG TPA: hypothetical protein VMU00_06855 [Steroidobacteraceae bacterium]|nr:hypothetical protein [Steroidobacteraceae bacterium]
MPRFLVCGGTLELPAAFVLPRAPSSAPEAWTGGQWLTVRICEATPALRVHTAGRAFPGRPASHAAGAWVAIGDVIWTAAELASSRALPGAFTHTSDAEIAAGTVVNVGFASALFGGAGGGEQAEYVSGPAFRFRSLEGKRWHGRAGTAG